jgi:hypothetical protein
MLFAQNNYVFGPSVRVNDDPAGTYSHRTTQRAIACSGDTVYLVWGDNRAVSAQVVFSKSTDAGTSWSPNIVISQDIDTLVCVLPHMILDASGNIYVAYSALHDNMTNVDIFFTKSTDCGISFTPAVMVNDSASIYHQRYPSITVDSSGQHVYVVWQDWRNLQYEPDIYFSRSTDGGLTFLPSIRVNDDLDTANQWSPVVACDNSGQNVYVAWQDQRDTLHDWDVYFSRSTDYGQTFEANYPVNDTNASANSFQGRPSICWKNGIINIAFDDWRTGAVGTYFDKSIDSGISFGQDVCVVNIYGASAYPSIIVDDSSHVFFVWEDGIYFSFSSDSGETFSEDVLVNDHEGIISAWDWNPAICVNDSGEVFVAWSSTRNDPAFNKFDIYCTAGTYVGIEEYHKPQACLTFRCYPNPFAKRMNITFDAGCSAEEIELKIYDATGRLVKDFSHITSNASHSALSTTHITWYGDDEQGRQVSAGVYFVEFIRERGRYSKKVVEIR